MAYMFCALGSQGMIFSPYQRLIDRLPEWLSWPLGKCFKCFTGQVMLWYFIFTHKFDVFELLFFVSAGIFVSMIWDKLYRILDK
jgi:hypothetical protein